MYARNKEALVKTRASQELPIGTFNPSQSSFTGAVPATIALHRSPRDKAILRYRDQVVKTEGDFEFVDRADDVANDGAEHGVMDAC